MVVVVQRRSPWAHEVTRLPSDIQHHIIILPKVTTHAQRQNRADKQLIVIVSFYDAVKIIGARILWAFSATFRHPQISSFVKQYINTD